MTYAASIFVDNVEEAGIITDMFDLFGCVTNDIRKADTVVIRCSVGFITVHLDDAPIFTVH